MNILQELKERLDSCVSKRNAVEKKLQLSDEYQQFLELQQEISEVSRAIKALEHNCSSHYGMQGLINQRQGY
jgi:vacuolar-type H+-ATPase subunit D/Vma8